MECEVLGAMIKAFILLQAVAAYALTGCIVIAAVNVCARSKPGAQDVLFGLIWPLTVVGLLAYGFARMLRMLTAEIMDALRRAKK